MIPNQVMNWRFSSSACRPADEVAEEGRYTQAAKNQGADGAVFLEERKQHGDHEGGDAHAEEDAVHPDGGPVGIDEGIQDALEHDLVVLEAALDVFTPRRVSCGSASASGTPGLGDGGMGARLFRQRCGDRLLQAAGGASRLFAARRTVAASVAGRTLANAAAYSLILVA